MSVIVYAVGRPGSGKSTAVRCMEKLAKDRGYVTTHLRDYTILLAMNAEADHSAKFRLNMRGGFDIIDEAAYDIALCRLIEQLKYLEKSKEYEIIFVEFARKTYEASFEKLNECLQNKYFILCVEADIDTCIERIDKRTTGLCGPDQHFVSEKIMRTYYFENNLLSMNENFARRFGLPAHHIEAIYNESKIEELEKSAKKYANIVCESIKQLEVAHP